jgi:hypothetical protein
VTSIPQLLGGTSVIQLPKIIQKNYTSEGTSPDLDKLNYARPLSKKGSYVCGVIFKTTRLLPKDKLMSFTNAFYLSKDNITFNGI